jgi:Tfp pilus assembly protein PilE
MDIGARTVNAGGLPARQRGLTILGFMLVAAVVVVFAMVGFRVVPSYVEYFSVKKALEDTMRGGSAAPLLYFGAMEKLTKARTQELEESLEGR